MKKEKIKFLMLLILAFHFWKNVSAQQDAMFTHYMFNTLAVNPGYAGTRDVLTATVINRNQWVGFKGAPVTQTFTIQSPVFQKKLGIGLSFISDKAGPIKNTGIFFDCAYRLKISRRAKIAFGLKGGVSMLNTDLKGINLDQGGDISFQNNFTSSILPNFGFGFYYFREKLFVGVSCPKVLENNYSTNEVSGSIDLIKNKKHFFFIAGHYFQLNSEVELKAFSFVKMTFGAPVEADLTANFIFNKQFSIGGMFRSGDAIGLLVGCKLTEQLYLGYSFDWSYGLSTAKYNNGSHEIVLRYDFIFKEQNQISSPRHF